MDGKSLVDSTPSRNKKFSPHIFRNCLLCKIFALKENYCSKQTNNPQGFPHGEIRMSH